MDIRAQLSMVLHLDKCIGCHTCSVTCKNLWTNRKGAEYMWWNNVETRPGLGYPKNWENQDKFAGGWEISGSKIKLRSGGKGSILARIFNNKNQPVIDDYYEPFTYDYENLLNAPESKTQPIARAKSQITGKNMEIKSGPNWDDDLGGSSLFASNDPNLTAAEQKDFEEFEKIYMMYLPRICNHCLNPACVAACPSSSIYKRGEDGIVLNDQSKCRGWRYCISGCPYKKIYFNHKSGKSEKCLLCYPKMENGQATVCSHSCVGRIRYLGVILYDYDKLAEVETAAEKDLVQALKDCILDPHKKQTQDAARKAGISEDFIDGAKKSPVYKFVKEYDLALPLHPEYRTFPMVFYVPSLSPILQNAGMTDDMTMENLRIPLNFMASLFTAGNKQIVEESVRKLLGIRKYMRGLSNKDEHLKNQGKNMTGWDADKIEDAYKLTSLAHIRDRFVIPLSHKESTASFQEQGEKDFNIQGL